MINVRQKGATGERDIADDLNLIINTCRLQLGIPIPGTPTVQRNQNQSAVGGKDLVGTFGLAIEVKRQEALSINTWWRQCVASAQPLKEVPVLLFRQNKKPWRCITLAALPVPGGIRTAEARVELAYEDFSSWFRAIVTQQLESDIRHDATRPIQQPGLFT